jgi:hypothetical protein
MLEVEAHLTYGDCAWVLTCECKMQSSSVTVSCSNPVLYVYPLVVMAQEPHLKAVLDYLPVCNQCFCMHPLALFAFISVVIEAAAFLSSLYCADSLSCSLGTYCLTELGVPQRFLMSV